MLPKIFPGEFAHMAASKTFMFPSRSTTPWLFSILAWLVAGGVCAAGHVDYFADNAYSNPISTMQHPNAEYANGVTYVTYLGPHEDPYVAAYDHASGKWQGPVQAGVNIMGKAQDSASKADQDAHGKPAMVVDRQGYVHVVFGGHGGVVALGANALGTPGGGRQIHVVSQKPGDISSWRELANISPSATYPQWVKLANGDLYLFYRHGSHRSDWVYQKSTDDGRTFSEPTSILKHKVSQASPTVHDAWYAWFDNGRGDTITAHYVYHPCANPGHSKDRLNAYYMLMNCRDGSWTNARGEALTLPVTKESADRVTRIPNAGSDRSNHGTCHVDAEGRPHVYFRQGGEVRYYRWLGDAWQNPVAVAAPDQGKGHDGDFVIESPTSIRMLLDQDNAGVSVVGWWNSHDGGLTWQKGPALLSSSELNFEASTLVRNAHPDARMLVASKSRKFDEPYHQMYLVGDKGPLGRPEAEANCLGEKLEREKAAMTLPKGAGKKKRKTAKAADEDPAAFETRDRK